jgi:type II secretory pathway predicted ATPase ExeA
MYWKDTNVHDTSIGNMLNPLASCNKHHQVQSLEKELLHLSRMKHREEQLVLFLTGAGGSGKSKVITNVLWYRKGFCKLLGQQFDSHTIVVTALTRVVAMLIHGKTLSLAALLNQKRCVTIEQMKEWENAQLVIIDEISFAKGSALLTLHKQLTALREGRSKKYGGLNLVFAGNFHQLAEAHWRNELVQRHESGAVA